jgi:hypothetical protein
MDLDWYMQHDLSQVENSLHEEHRSVYPGKTKKGSDDMEQFLFLCLSSIAETLPAFVTAVRIEFSAESMERVVYCPEILERYDLQAY